MKWDDSRRVWMGWHERFGFNTRAECCKLDDQHKPRRVPRTHPHTHTYPVITFLPREGWMLWPCPYTLLRGKEDIPEDGKQKAFPTALQSLTLKSGISTRSFWVKKNGEAVLLNSRGLFHQSKCPMYRLYRWYNLAKRCKKHEQKPWLFLYASSLPHPGDPIIQSPHPAQRLWFLAGSSELNSRPKHRSHGPVSRPHRVQPSPPIGFQDLPVEV